MKFAVFSLVFVCCILSAMQAKNCPQKCRKLCNIKEKDCEIKNLKKPVEKNCSNTRCVERIILTAKSEVLEPNLQPLEGCPSEIPIIEDGKIVAGKIYHDKGNDLPELSCLGDASLWPAETKLTFPSSDLGQFGFPFGSVIINPGCTLIVFQDYNYAGSNKKFIGPQTIPNPPKDATIKDCGLGDVPCVKSLLWTCKQTYPSCIPEDKWQIVTELDNSAQSLSAQFTYEKKIGTEWSHSMTESLSVGVTVSNEVSASFFELLSDKLTVSATTGYDWSTTDSSTKSEIETYSVSVTVPPKTKLLIEAVLGSCGGSKIHTQMFRVLDTNNVTLRTYHGAMTSYDLTI